MTTAVRWSVDRARMERARGSAESLIARISPGRRHLLNDGFALSVAEHEHLRTVVSRGRDDEVVTSCAAGEIADALGDSYNEQNGGWADDADLVTKVAVTSVVVEMLGKERGGW